MLLLLTLLHTQNNSKINIVIIINNVNKNTKNNVGVTVTLSMKPVSIMRYNSVSQTVGCRPALGHCAMPAGPRHPPQINTQLYTH